MDLGNLQRWEKEELAMNPNTEEDLLLALATDAYYEIRWHVAENPKSSGKILVSLFEYEKSLYQPCGGTIRALHHHKNLPQVAKVIIETLFGEWL